MNPEYEPYELIDRYLQKAMSQDERLHFEERLASDENLQELMEAQKIANEYLIDQELLKLKNRMQLEMGSEGNGGNSIWNKVLITSSAALIAGGALYLLIGSDTIPAKQSEITQPISEIIVSKDQEKENIGANNKVSNTKTTASTLVSTSPVISVPETQSFVSVNEPKEIQETTTTSLNENQETAKTISNSVSVKENTAVNCDLIKIEGHAKINYGFHDDDEPQIIVNEKTIRGGKAPYSYSLDKKHFTSENSFDQLKDGTYHVYIRDNHNCISELSNVLVVKKPIKEIDQSFSPANGSRWDFPLKTNTEGSITIFNKAGIIVYTTNITGGYPNDWDGRDNNGKELDSGNYSFIINFANNEFVKGHITIFK